MIGSLDFHRGLFVKMNQAAPILPGSFLTAVIRASCLPVFIAEYRLFGKGAWPSQLEKPEREMPVRRFPLSSPARELLITRMEMMPQMKRNSIGVSLSVRLRRRYKSGLPPLDIPIPLR
jgi:hypothetical protein